MNEFQYDLLEHQPTGKIVSTTPEKKSVLNARTLATAFWASYFMMHWLLILGVVERTSQRSGTALFFFVFAVLLTLLIDVRGDPKEKK